MWWQRKLKLKEENGQSPTDNPTEAANDDAGKKRRGAKRKRSAVDTSFDFEEDFEPKIKRRRMRDLARELIDTTGSSISIGALLTLLNDPNGHVILNGALEHLGEEPSDKSNEIYIEPTAKSSEDSIMLDLVDLELKEIAMREQKEMLEKEALENKDKEMLENKEKEQLNEISGQKRSSRNNTNNDTNNNTNNTNNNLDSSYDDSPMRDIEGLKSNELQSAKDEPGTEIKVSETPKEDDGKRTRRGRKTSLPAKYADSLSLDTVRPQMSENALTDETDKPKDEKKDAVDKEKEKEKPMSAAVTVPKTEKNGRKGRKADTKEKKNQKKTPKNVSKLSSIFRHISHVFNENDFDDVVFVKLNGYPRWPAAVVKVEAEERLPGQIMRYKPVPKRGEQSRCLAFLRDPKAPYTWLPNSVFIPFNENSVGDLKRALRLKLGVRLGESLEDGARLHKYLYPDKHDLIQFVHEFRMKHDPYYNPASDLHADTKTTENNNSDDDSEAEAERPAEVPEEKPKEIEIKETEPPVLTKTDNAVVGTDRASRAKTRRSTAAPPTPPTKTMPPKSKPVAYKSEPTEVKPSTSSVESTDAQQTSSAESMTIDLTVAEVAGASSRSPLLRDEEAVLNVLMELALPDSRPNNGNINELTNQTTQKYHD